MLHIRLLWKSLKSSQYQNRDQCSFVANFFSWPIWILNNKKGHEITMFLKGFLGHFWYEKIQNIAIFRPEKSLLSIQTCLPFSAISFWGSSCQSPSFLSKNWEKKHHPGAQTNMKSLERVVHAPPIWSCGWFSLFGTMNPFEKNN